MHTLLWNCQLFAIVYNMCFNNSLHAMVIWAIKYNPHNECQCGEEMRIHVDQYQANDLML